MNNSINSSSSKSLFPIFFTVLIDFLGLGLVIPIFAPMFLDRNYAILPLDAPLAIRTVTLGLLLSTYPIATFIGSPILGGLSDRIGRKKALLISLFGTFLGYFFTGFAVHYHSLSLLFVCRFLTGFAGGNAAIAYATIADLSPLHLRSRNFSLIAIGFSIGFTLGPFIGGKLSDSSIVSWFNYAVPFWFACFLSLLNIFSVWINLKETIKVKRNTSISLLTGIYRIKKAFSLRDLRLIFMAIFLYSFGWYSFTQIFQVFLIEKFQVDNSVIGDVYAYMGVWMIVLQFLVTRPLSKRLSPGEILFFSMPMIVVTLFCLLLPNTLALLLIQLPLVVAFQGLTQPNVVALASSSCDESSLGQILGISQSMQALAMAIAPMITGSLIALRPDLPVLMGVIFIFLAWVVFLIYYCKKKKN